MQQIQDGCGGKNSPQTREHSRKYRGWKGPWQSESESPSGRFTPGPRLQFYSFHRLFQNTPTLFFHHGSCSRGFSLLQYFPGVSFSKCWFLTLVHLINNSPFFFLFTCFLHTSSKPDFHNSPPAIQHFTYFYNNISPRRSTRAKVRGLFVWEED